MILTNQWDPKDGLGFFAFFPFQKASQFEWSFKSDHMVMEIEYADKQCSRRRDRRKCTVCESQEEV